MWVWHCRQAWNISGKLGLFFWFQSLMTYELCQVVAFAHSDWLAFLASATLKQWAKCCSTSGLWAMEDCGLMACNSQPLRIDKSWDKLSCHRSSAGEFSASSKAKCPWLDKARFGDAKKGRLRQSSAVPSYCAPTIGLFCISWQKDMQRLARPESFQISGSENSPQKKSWERQFENTFSQVACWSSFVAWETSRSR